MNQEEEKGFLSNKFEDWSSEPIPNGWGKIESILEEDRKNTLTIWAWAIPLIFVFLGSAGYLVLKNTKSNTILNSSSDFILTKPQNSLAGPKIHTFNTIEIAENITTQGNNNFSINDNRPSQNFKSISKKASSISGNSKTKIAYNHKQMQQSDGYKKTAMVLGPTLSMAPILDDIDDTESISAQQINDNTFQEVDDNHVSNPAYNESNSYSSVAFDAQNNNKLCIENLENKDSKVSTCILPDHKLERIVLPPIDELRKPRKFSYWAGASMGYSSRSITINQTESINIIKIQDISKPKESWFSQVHFYATYGIAGWLKAFTGIQIGILKQSIQVENTSKTPQKFDRVQKDSLSFTFSPTHVNSTDVRKQELIYGNLEFGLKPLIFKKLNSGPFASVVVWSVITQKSSKTNVENANFERPEEKVDLSYRLGYQHEIVRNLSAELFLAGFPSLIASQTKGIRVNPNLLGFGLCYKVR